MYICEWLKFVMKMAGIDVSIFTLHSIQSAVTSAVLHTQVSMNKILKTEVWTRNSTFLKYYNKLVEGKGQPLL